MQMTAKSKQSFSIGAYLKNAPALKSSVDNSVVWRKVLIQALKDMAGPSGVRQLEVAQWVHSPQFDRMCRQSRVKPEAVQAMMRALALADKRERKLLVQDMIRKIEANPASIENAVTL